MNFGWTRDTSFFNKNTNAHTLLDIKHIFIFTAIRRGFFFLGIAMQVVDINIGKRAH